MSKHVFQQTVAALLIGLLSGCAPGLWGGAPATEPAQVERASGMHVIHEGDRTTLVRDEAVLKGRVTLDDGTRRAQAVTADIVSSAIVSIIDTATNVTVTTSTTDGSGYFQIPLPASWNPSNGSNFVIEAVRATSQAGGVPVLRLRSLIQKLSGNGNFASITGTNSIAISPMTTAVYLRSAAGVGAGGYGGASAIPLAAAGVYGTGNLGTVNPATGALAGANQFSTWTVTDQQLLDLNTMIGDHVAINLDPVAGAASPSLLPTLSGLSAASATVGDLVVLNGTGFSPVIGAATVSFNPGVVAPILFGSTTQLVVAVPAGATTGNVTVQTRVGTSGAQSLTVSSPYTGGSTPPWITGVSPRSIQTGQTLTLTGSNFLNGTNNVVFSTGAGTTTVAATYVNAQKLTVAVPGTAKSGAVLVTNAYGSSNGYWLDVFHASGALTEDFSTTTYFDGGTSTLNQWSGGFSAAGTTVSGGNVITLADWDTLNPDHSVTNLQDVYDAKNTTYPAGIQLAYNEAAYPVANNSYIPADQYSDGGPVTSYSLATNGSKLLVLNPTPNLYFAGHGLGDLRPFAGSNQLNQVLPNWAGLSTNFKFVGFSNTNLFFYLDETSASISQLTWRDLTNPLGPSVSGVPNLYAADGTSAVVISKIVAGSIGGSNYGLKIASDGTYLFILGGTATVAGAGTYTNAINLYRFRPDSYSAPTKLILSRVYQNLANPTTALQYNQYVQFMVDHRGFYMPGYGASGTADSYALYSLRNGANLATNVGFFRRNGSYVTGCYDAINDQYLTANYSSNMWFRDRFMQANYMASGNVTTSAISLPADQQWGSVSLVTDTLPAGTGVTVDVLTGAGAAIPGYSGLTNVSGISLQGASTAYQGSLKFRINLTSNSPYSATPVVRALVVRTIPSNPMVQSLAYQFPGTTSSDKVIVDAVTLTHSTYGGTLVYSHNDSSDNVTYGGWGDGLLGISKAYFKMQIVASPSQSVTQVYQAPIVKKIVIQYHY